MKYCSVMTLITKKEGTLPHKRQSTTLLSYCWMTQVLSLDIIVTKLVRHVAYRNEIDAAALLTTPGKQGGLLESLSMWVGEL